MEPGGGSAQEFLWKAGYAVGLFSGTWAGVVNTRPHEPQTGLDNRRSRRLLQMQNVQFDFLRAVLKKWWSQAEASRGARRQYKSMA